MCFWDARATVARGTLHGPGHSLCASQVKWAVMARRKKDEDLSVDSEEERVERRRREKKQEIPERIDLSDTSERTPSWIKRKRR